MTTLNKEPINTGQYLNELPTIARGAGILFLGALIGKMLAFFFNIFIARMLTPGELGLYYLGLTLISLLGTFALFGFRRIKICIPLLWTKRYQPCERNYSILLINCHSSGSSNGNVIIFIC